METYEKSVLEYRDVRSAVGHAFDRGDEQGFGRGVETTARKCLQEGMSIELVSKVTGLSAEQLINL
jgi:hypothetical protein